MMMSYEDYEDELKKMTIPQLRTEIRSLKRTINRLKFTVEDPDYVSRRTPDEKASLSFHFGYLKAARKFLAAAGGEYIPTKAEQKAAEFQDNIPNISLISFYSDAYTEDYELQYIKISDGKLFGFTGSAQTGKPEFTDITTDRVNTEKLFEGISRLHLGEWQRHYNSSAYEKTPKADTAWKLKISYSNGRRPFVSDGSGVYPHNYRRMEELLEEFIP